MHFADNPEANRYELRDPDASGTVVAFADYRREGDRLVIPHVEVTPEHQGTGLAGNFMRKLLEEIRAQENKVTPTCTYAATWINRHPEFQDLLAK